MWWRRLYSAIESLLGGPASVSEEALRELDPDKIYPEQVRSLLGTSKWLAEEICEDATRRGLFVRHIEVLSPYAGNAVAIVEAPEDFPESVTVWRPVDDDFVEETLDTANLEQLVYYSLNDEEAEKAGITK